MTIIAMAVFLVLSYGGIRSPDSDVVFLTTQALAEEATFARSDPFIWTGFGLHQGVDGQYYSIFGPAESIVAVPLYKLADFLNEKEWFWHFPDLVATSHYVDNGSIPSFIADRPPLQPQVHALRTITALLNVIVTGLSVGLFFLICRDLSQSSKAALLNTVLFAFGSLTLPYSGTFFSEPMATLFVLLALYCMVRYQRQDAVSSNLLIGSGLALGAAIATHISAILFAPFFFYYALVCRPQAQIGKTERIRNGISFSAGIVLLLSLLSYYNYLRFGNPLETGRTTDPNMVYASFTLPWEGIWALLFSSGKGLLIYCPAAIVALLLWRPFHHRYPQLSIMLITAIVFRWLFIASRSDWHGGFCLGPRYLVVILPLMLLPLSVVLAEWLQQRKTKQLAVFGLFTFLCIGQQLFFSLGEIFAYLHNVKWQGMAKNFDVFKDNFIYLSWDVSPALHLLEFKRGPLLLKGVPLSNFAVWGLLLSIAAFFLILLYYNQLRGTYAKGGRDQL